MARTSAKPRTIAVDVDEAPRKQPREWPWPWYVAAVLGPIAVLLAGWLILAALGAVGWLTSPEADLGPALALATRFLVLAHGAPLEIGGLPVSIIPLGITATLILLAVPVAAFAARHAAGQSADPDDTGKLWVDGEALTLKVGGTFAGVYTVAVAILMGALGVLSLRGLIGALAVGVVAGLWGAAHGVGFDPTDAWPEWLRSVPRAMGAALLLVLAGGAAVLVVALWAGRDRVGEIVTNLDGGAGGLVLLVALHLAYLPNLILACVSWMLGAGVTVGDGSLITLTSSEAGLLPAVPIFGIVPPPDGGSAAHLWWLAVGAVAGAIAALVVTLARPRARFDETALVGALAGVLAGGFAVVACAIGSGSLGSDRLAFVGARLLELAIFAPTLLGLSGMAVGLVLGLLRRPRTAPEAVEPAAQEAVELGG